MALWYWQIILAHFTNWNESLKEILNVDNSTKLWIPIFTIKFECLLLMDLTEKKSEKFFRN